MTPENLSSALMDVRRLRQGFASTAPQQWTATTAAAEITVQLGHVARCLLHRRGGDTTDIDDPQRPIANLGDELADVLLAALSVTTLAGMEPDPGSRRDARSTNEMDAFLRLLAWAGQLAEAAMVGEGFRHQPTGKPPSIPAASATVVTACEAVADHFGLDLLTEFRAMVTDADAFLNERGATR